MEGEVSLKGNIRYRWVERGGKKIRLAFRGKKKVVEVKVKGGKAKKVGGGGKKIRVVPKKS